MLEVVPLRYRTAFKKAFSDPLAFHALVEAAAGIDFMPTASSRSTPTASRSRG